MRARPRPPRPPALPVAPPPPPSWSPLEENPPPRPVPHHRREPLPARHHPLLNDRPVGLPNAELGLAFVQIHAHRIHGSRASRCAPRVSGECVEQSVERSLPPRDRGGPATASCQLGRCLIHD